MNKLLFILSFFPLLASAQLPKIMCIDPVVNTAPTVNAGTSQTMTEPYNGTTLSGSATPTGTASSIASYTWSQLSGPNTGTFSSTSITNPTFTNLIAGTYSLRLTAVDNLGNSGSGTVSIVVNANTGFDSMRVQMYVTITDTVAGWSHCYGDPSTATRSVIGGNNHGIVFATLNPSYYGQIGGVGIGPNNGQPTTTTWNYAQGVLAEDQQNANNIDTTKHLAQFSGLIAGHTYVVSMAGTFTSAYNYALLGAYDVAGTSWGTIQTQSCNSNTIPNPAQLSWTVTAPTNGIVTIAWGTSGTGQIGAAFGATTIKQTN